MDLIQNDCFWDKMCKMPNSRKFLIEEMNEIYYSNPAPFFAKRHLYGSAANLIPHRDCILFNFAMDILVINLMFNRL